MRFLALCFKVILPTLADFYRLSWRSLFDVTLPEKMEDGTDTPGSTGVFVLLLASVARTLQRLFLLATDVVNCIGHLLLLVFGLVISLIFPFLVFIWAPLTAYKVLKYEKEISQRYEEWERK